MKYREAGVDLDKARDIKIGIQKFLHKDASRRFSGVFPFDDKNLVATIDGVGTKTKVAQMTGNYKNLGYDVVNHCVNDLLCSGAKPLFFLDYIASSKLKEDVVLEIIHGIREALDFHHIQLLGGETAEMPGIYQDKEWDIVGCLIGEVQRENILPKTFSSGSLVYGLSSSGLHTNGFSLARKVLFQEGGMDINDHIPGDSRPLSEILSAYHRSYFPSLYFLIQRGKIKALSHITGGGFKGNIIRILSPDCDVTINFEGVPIPPIFKFIREKGKIAQNEMFEVFNMGIGMVAIVDPGEKRFCENFWKENNEEFYLLGMVEKGSGEVKISY